MPQPPSPFLGLQHIGLKVHDIEAALDFYVGKLGFTVTEIPPPGRVPGAAFGLAFLRCTGLHHDVSLFFWRRWECPASEVNT
ncbi:MAG: VOC family protein, partial [Candidatus Tectomicrobia bacterium]|nr:VOC family protein [Candidatus Tectomicrobia bacterium]